MLVVKSLWAPTKLLVSGEFRMLQRMHNGELILFVLQIVLAQCVLNPLKGFSMRVQQMLKVFRNLAELSLRLSKFRSRRNLEKYIETQEVDYKNIGRQVKTDDCLPTTGS